MSVATQTYSFVDTTLSIVGPAIALIIDNNSATAEEAITIDPSEDILGKTMGADGSGMFSLYADKSGRITLRLLKTSPLNFALMQAYNYQQSSGVNAGKNTITLAQAALGDIVTCEFCGFARAPNLAYGKAGGVQEWVFESIRINRLLGPGL